MPRFVILIEKGEHNYSAFVPDVDGVVATGKTLDETVENMRSALEAHLEFLAEDSDPMPVPTIVASSVVNVEYPEPVREVN